MAESRDNITVLVVDDDEIVRRLLVKILSAQGFHVREAGLSANALKMMDGSVKLVLLDIMLPDYDGMNLLARIRRRFSKESLKVCFVSSLSETDTVARCLSLGAQDYIVKPIDREVILHKVTRLLGHSDAGFAWVLADLAAELREGPVLPDMTVVRVSEGGLLIKSTARIQVDEHVHLDVPGLNDALGVSIAAIPQRIVVCETRGRGLYFIETEFTGLPDKIAQCLRAVAIRGKALTSGKTAP